MGGFRINVHIFTSVMFCLKLFILLKACGMQSEQRLKECKQIQAMDTVDLLMCFVCICREDELRGSSAPRKLESGIMKLTT